MSVKRFSANSTGMQKWWIGQLMWKNILKQESITHFQNLLYSSRIDAVLPDYDMPVDELSKLCCTRWLSSHHICWMTEMLNKAQGETYCVFMNYVGNVKRFVTQRIAPLQAKPSKYLFILNAGRDRGSVI